jgi:hypothetical protein
MNEIHLIPGANVHKNIDNNNVRMTNDTRKSIVIEFIQKKGKADGEVYATHIIRSQKNQELQDEEKGVLDLPTNTTKRELYKKYCFDRGLAIKSYNKGHYPKLTEYSNCKAGGMFWPSDTDRCEV